MLIGEPVISPLASVTVSNHDDELLIITNEGMIIRTEIKNISLLGRATQGVKLINLREGDTVSAIEVIEGDHDEESLFDEPAATEGETAPPVDTEPKQPEQ